MLKYTSNIVSPMISIAPMVDKTDRHFRYFTRLLSKDVLLYTEMITAQSILHGDLDKLLYFRKEEGDVALQIAASNPEDAYQAIKLAESYDYKEINLNCGCPSDRVSGNLMGAALMSSKELVYEILCAMKEATTKPVTIKHRIGIDGTGIIDDPGNKVILEGYQDLLEFLSTITKAKPDRYTIHARTAILQGLSPKDNREIPPLDYDMVYRLKEEFPYLNIEINGGFKDIDSIKEALTKVDGVMLGRVAYEDCYVLAKLGQVYHPDSRDQPLSRGQILKSYLPYILEELDNGNTIFSLTNPLQSLFQGQRGSKAYRQLLASNSLKKYTISEVIDTLLNDMPDSVLWSIDEA